MKKISRRLSWFTVLTAALLGIGALATFATPAEAVFARCHKICWQAPSSATCSCWSPGGYIHLECEQWQANGCSLSLTASMSSDATQREAVMSFDGQPLFAAPEVALSPAEEQISAPAPAADCQIPEPASQPAAQLLAPSSD